MNVSIRELRDHLSSYLRKVKAGEDIVVTSYNRPLAQLVPYKTNHEQGDLQARLNQIPGVRWNGKKPKRPLARPRMKNNASLADYVLEDRR